jgi:two-component system, sensor histidine kinase YesM
MFTMPSYYRNIISNETAKLTESTMEALMGNIDTYLDDLERLTSIPYRKEFMDALVFQNSIKDISKNETVSYYDRFKSEAEILDTLIFTLQSTRKDISGAIMVTVDGMPIITNKKFGTRPETTPNYIFTAQDWYKKAAAADGKAVFINIHPQDYLSQYSTNQVFSIARLIKEPATQKWMGVIMADADTSGLDDIFKGVSFNVHSIVSIFDSDNNLVYSNKSIQNEVKSQIFSGNKIIKSSG